MKNIKCLFVVLILTLFSSISFAHEWEIGFKIINNGQPDTNFTVQIYGFNVGTGVYDHLIDVTHNKWFDGDINIICDQRTYNGDIYTPTYYNPAYPVVSYADQYLFRFGNNCVIYKVNPTKFHPDIAGDWSVTYDIGTGSISEGPSNNGGMWEWKGTTSWSNIYTFTLKNDINAGNITLRSTSYSSGTQLTRQESSFPHSVYASSHDQTIYIGGSNYKVYFKTWQTTNRSPINNAGFDLEKSDINPSPNTNEVKAFFAKLCNLSFEYYFQGATRNGYMVVGDTSRYLTATVYRRDDNTLSATAADQAYNSMLYTFDYWKKNGTQVSTNPTYSFTPDIHATYTAVMKGWKPTNSYRNLSFNTSEEGQPVKVTWSKHPLDNSDVTQYAVYRRVTTQGSPTLLTTVTANGSSEYIYTDEDFAICSGENKILLFYDVRAYYAPNTAYADVDFGSVYGFYNTSINTDNFVQNISIGERPTEYSITNYPNPFNPTTTINYQLPQDGFVTIKVYDMLGKEIATLVNENKSAGYYKVNFDARRLTSGVYIYTINAGKYNHSKKMLLMK